jgi:hypothetical protein
MRRFAVLLVAALGTASAAHAAGPWLGTMNGGAGVVDGQAGVSYVTLRNGQSTTVEQVRRSDRKVLASTRVDGRWGIPYVTLSSGVGGLSPDGRVLVLAEQLAQNGELHKETSFTVVRTRPLAVSRTIRLRGDFGFDALSPDGRTLYLIEHASQRDLLKYRVRAYDLRADRLVAGVIADKRQTGWLMSGWPVARAASTGGRWVYTLYANGDNYPFVHALDTMSRTAICIGLPWDWRAGAQEIQNADLRVSGGNLLIAGGHGAGTRFALDTATFRIAKLSS